MELEECGFCVALFTRIPLALHPGWLLHSHAGTLIVIHKSR